jgi:CubicO group peptidase (beta-lactamase class C family)
MNDSVVFDQTNPKIKNRATSYARGDDGKSFENIDYTPLNLIYGDGAVNTNLEDMFKWDQALYTEKLVKAATLRQAFTRGKLNDGKEIDYGFGWFPRQVFGLETVSHTGGWAGFRTYIVRYPAQRFSVVVLSNFAQFSPGAIGNKIARIYLQDKMKLPVVVKLDNQTLEKYAGRYQMPANSVFVWEIKPENGALIVKTPSQTLKLLPESETKFFVENSEDIKITFKFDEKGVVNGFVLLQSIERAAKKL